MRVGNQSSGLVEHGDDLEATAGGIARSLSTWFPFSTHPGGSAWEVATGQLPSSHAVMWASGKVAGWAAFPEGDSRVECAPEDTATTETLAAWLLEDAGLQQGLSGCAALVDDLESASRLRAPTSQFSCCVVPLPSSIAQRDRLLSVHDARAR